MKSIDSFPAPDHELRERLPYMRPSTIENLHRWGLSQPGALPWLMQRTALYWDKFPKDSDERHRLIDAVAALDLLRWRIENGDDRVAVGHLAEVEHLTTTRWPGTNHDNDHAQD